MQLRIDATIAVLCGLLPATVLQGYMLYGKNVSHTIGTYPYNQMLFYTFGFATLLWMISLTKTVLRDATVRERAWTRGFALVAAGGGLFVVIERDARRERVSPERDPVEVVKKLKPLRDQFAGHYYYDPHLEHASYFVTRCVLGRDSGNAARYRLHCHQRDADKMFEEPELKGIFVPLDAWLRGGMGSFKERVGDFWKIDLEAWRRHRDHPQPELIDGGVEKG